MERATALTPRQQQVIELLRHGHANSEIAAALGISEDGVKAHLSRLYLRFDVTNRVALLAAIDGVRSNGHSSLGELRAIADNAQARSQQLVATAPSSRSSDKLAVAREALAAVDVALELVRDLPPETTGVLLDALRRKVSAAVAALGDVDGAPVPVLTRSARTV